MFDIEKCIDNNKKNVSLKERYKKLQSELNEVNQLTNYIKNSCEHDLVVMFGKSGLCMPQDGYSVCISCGKTFNLYSKDKGIISEDNIINLCELVEKGLITDRNFHAYSGLCGQEKHILLTRIIEKLEDIYFQNPKITLEETKDKIIQDLIMYDKELNSVVKKELKRNDINE